MQAATESMPTAAQKRPLVTRRERLSLKLAFVGGLTKGSGQGQSIWECERVLGELGTGLEGRGLTKGVGAVGAVFRAPLIAFLHL